MNEEFTQFTHNFDFKEKEIKRKYFHSLRVQTLCENIAKEEKLPDDKIAIISAVGLLHDYGRFYQWTKYHTFSDQKSIDHGDYAVDELFNKNHIKDYVKNKKDYSTIYNAIKYHNKYAIPKELKKEDQIMCKIIRDADKLDILYIYTLAGLTSYEKGEITPDIATQFKNHELILSVNRKSKIDYILQTLALVYDLNFSYSFKYLKSNKTIDKIFKQVLNKEKLEPYFIEINKYIDNKIREEEEKC